MSIEKWEFLATLGVFFVILEIFVPSFYMIPIGISLLVTALAAVWFESWLILLGVFAIAGLGNFFIFRKLIAGKNQQPAILTNVEGLIGKECEVIADIRPGTNGTVKLYGDTWVAYNSMGKEFNIGDRVIIEKTDGNKVVVRSMN